MTQLTDLEMERLCAEAMGFEFIVETGTDVYAANIPGAVPYTYNPLENDAQAMALVRDCELDITRLPGALKWRVSRWVSPSAEMGHATENYSLNRAIVECVAKIQAAHTKA